MRQRIDTRQLRTGTVLSVLLAALLLFANSGLCEMYGIMSPSGEFEPKVTVTVSHKEIVIKKTDPQERFQSISMQVNPRNSALLRNVGLLKIEWIDAQNRSGRPVPFTGPRYDPATRKFEDIMLKSVGMKVLNTSTRELFAGKTLADLFTIKINGEPIVSGESHAETGRTVKMGAGRDLSINVNKTSILFNESNFRKGEIVDVDNRSGLDQVLGVEVPTAGLLYSRIVKRLDNKPIAGENWNRFIVPADSGVFIVLIPEPDPALVSQLDGKELKINIYERNRIRETRKIPIKIAPELMVPGAGSRTDLESERYALQPRPGESVGPRTTESVPNRKTTEKREAPSTKESITIGRWIWIFQICNLVLLIGLGAYGMLFVLPKVQVLEDRLAKNEMFIHGTREAIREELEQIKEEILRQCQQDTDAE